MGEKEGSVELLLCGSETGVYVEREAETPERKIKTTGVQRLWD